MLKLLLGIFLLLPAKSNGLATVDPDIEWKTLNTTHFEIIYDARHRHLAVDYAEAAESAHSVLSKIFKDLPTRTIIWIDDREDSTNGLATPFPRPMIEVYPVLPGSADSITYYNHWSHSLLMHEYTHILNMEPAHGFLSPFRFLFGSVVRPNALLPTWYLEGLAVEEETRHTHFGRLKSPFFGALVRAMVQDGTWSKENLGAFNETRMPTWPAGLRPYFWGSLIMNEIVERKGESAITDLNIRYAKRIPFTVDGPLEDLLGVNYSKFLEQIRERYKKIAVAQIAAISQDKKSTVLLKNTDPNGHDPDLSPDRLKLVYVRQNDDGESEIHLLKRTDPRQDFNLSDDQFLFLGRKIDKISWQDERTFVFNNINLENMYSSFSDLYSFNTGTLETHRLTNGLRAQEAAVDPKTKNIVFVRVQGGLTQLDLLIGPKRKVLYSSALNVRISHPDFLDSERIVFAERKVNGEESLRIYDLRSNKVSDVLKNYAPARAPKMTSDGLLFLSEKNGVTNLYLADFRLDGAVAITNSATQVMGGTIDRNQIYYSQLTGKGFEIFREPIHKFPRLATVESPIDNHWPDVDNAIEHPAATDDDYSPMSYLWPQYWVPLVSYIPQGVAFQAITGANDPLQKHAYFLNATYDTLTNRSGGGAQYNLSVANGTLSALGQVQNYYYYAYNLTSTSSVEELSYTMPFSRNIKGWQMGYRGDHYLTDIPGVKTYEYAGPAVSLGYSNATQKPTQITPETGGSFIVDYQQFFASLGNVDFARTRANGTYYISALLPKRTALMAKVQSVWSQRNRSVLLGSTAGGDYSLSLQSEIPYVVRGYPIGEFVGWSVATGSLEYRFPIIDSPMGQDTTPIFLRRWHGAVFADTVTLDGVYYNQNTNTSALTGLGSFYYGTGAELRSDMTLGYHLPATLRFGVYYGLNANAFGGLTTFLNITLPQLL